MPLAWTGPLTPPPGLTGRLWRAVATLLLLVGLVAGGAAGAERIAITRALLGPSAEADSGVVLDAQFDFELPPALEDAVNRVIALYFVIEFEMHRVLWYWYDR